MGVKYRIEYYNKVDDFFKIDIDVPDYDGEINKLNGSGGEVFTKEIVSSDNNPFDEHIKSSQANINFILETDLDISDLQLCNDLEVKLKVYKNNELYWSGFVISDGLQMPFKGCC